MRWCAHSTIECRAVGDPIDGKFVILRTSDGESWEQLPTDQIPAALPSEGAFAASGTCLAIYSYEHVYFVTGGPAARLFHSSDAGYSWTVEQHADRQRQCFVGDFFDRRVGIRLWSWWAATTRIPIIPIAWRRIRRTKARRGNWRSRQPGGFRSAVARLDEKYLVAVGPNGEDVSDDGGAHWRQTDSLNLNALAVLRPKTPGRWDRTEPLRGLKSSPVYRLH